MFVFLVSVPAALAQTRVGGIVIDQDQEPVAFANVVFKGSTEGTITNENGRFYLESETRYDTLVISFVGYERRELPLASSTQLDMQVELLSGEQLDEVVVYVGRQSKKNNPAIDILRKIWSKKRVNGLRKFQHYEYDEPFVQGYGICL